MCSSVSRKLFMILVVHSSPKFVSLFQLFTVYIKNMFEFQHGYKIMNKFEICTAENNI